MLAVVAGVRRVRSGQGRGSQSSASRLMPIEPTSRAWVTSAAHSSDDLPIREDRILIEAERTGDYAPAACSDLQPSSAAPLRPAASEQVPTCYTTTVRGEGQADPVSASLPWLSGVVGEYFAIVMNDPWPLSMHRRPQVRQKKRGRQYQPDGPGRRVGPNAKFTYVWYLDESSGPLPDEPSSKGWLYHSHVKGDEEVNLGLIGFIIVTDPKRARPDGTPVDVDREQASLFMIFDESGLGEAEKEAREYASLQDGERREERWRSPERSRSALATRSTATYLETSPASR